MGRKEVASRPRRNFARMQRRKVTRWLIAIHRWMGLFLSILLGIWFLSGFVMMYVDFPGFGAEQRRQYAQPLDARTSKLLTIARDPAPGASGLPAQNESPVADSSFAAIRLSRLLDRPVWIMEKTDGEILVRYADDGTLMPSIDQATANRIAVAFFKNSCQPVSTERITTLDQWIPRSYYLVHMPIYRIKMNDAAHTWLYISSRSGEIIQKHDRRERILSWLGPIPHWIYPRDLIVRRPLWRQVVIVSSFAGALMCLSGIIGGFIRLRRNRRTNKYASPYKKRWLRWHHYTGLFFGTLTFTWVFSGLLSMNPLYWSPNLSLSSGETSLWQGGPLTTAKFTLPPGAISQHAGSAGKDIVEIRLTLLQGRPFYIAYDNSRNSFITPGDGGKDTSFIYFDKNTLIEGLKKQLPGAPITEATLIDREDNYYYSKLHTDKLPVWRVKFADTRQTWYYVDPSTGEVIYKYDKTSRLNRWLYHGFHSIDFSPLMRRRPLWDILVIILLLGGTAVSITGIVLTVKWIKRLFY